MPITPRTLVAGTAVALLTAGPVFGALAGCTRPKSADGPAVNTSGSATPAGPATRPDTTSPATPRTSSATGASPTGFSDATVVACNGRPTGEQVIAVVRRQTAFLTVAGAIIVRTGPLCAGDWQYTVFAVPDHEPLQVVTRGAPTALIFVTAGTDVCTVGVRSAAPVALLNVANC